MKSTAGAEQLPIGQLLIHLLRLFRGELAARGAAADGVEGIRPAHLQVFGAIKAEGSRLTELASAAGISLSAMAELVDDLEALGYLHRKPDPADRRAKLVCLTESGWCAIKTGRELIQQIEADWGARIGPDRYRALRDGMQDLLDALDHSIRARYTLPPDNQ